MLLFVSNGSSSVETLIFLDSNKKMQVVGDNGLDIKMKIATLTPPVME